MGTVIQNSTLRALILEAFSNDKNLMRDIFETIFKENPRLLEEYTSISNSVLVSETEAPVFEKMELMATVNGSTDINKFGKNQDSKTEGISNEELNFWIDKHFNEYDAVFKALA